jgi:hypothetical protein
VPYVSCIFLGDWGHWFESCACIPIMVTWKSEVTILKFVRIKNNNELYVNKRSYVYLDETCV